MKTQKEFKNLTGKELLTKVPADTLGLAEIDGENYILTPRKSEFINRVSVCKNEDADFVGVQDRWGSPEILVKV